MLHWAAPGSEDRFDAASRHLGLLRDEIADAGVAIDSVRRLASMGATRGSTALEGSEASFGDTVRIFEDLSTPAVAAPTRRAISHRGRAMARLAAMADDPTFVWGPEVVKELHFHAMSSEPAATPGLLRVEIIHVRGVPPYEPPEPALLRGLLDDVVEVIRGGSHRPLLAGAPATWRSLPSIPSATGTVGWHDFSTALR